ncbi:MAG TPA: HAD family hydrolase [Kofleriaceae bacterium]|nr:HAD family hydrolase [Kofleriaceae bacterium]
MHSFDIYLLDVDGTLVDSNDAHANAWVEALAARGHDVPYDRVRRMIGMGGDRLVEELVGYPRGSDDNAKLGKERSQLFKDRWLRTVRPLPGSRELVLRLRESGRRYAIASAATKDELGPLLEIANIVDLARIKTSSTEVEESKPDPEIVKAALAKLGSDGTSAVMVGDTPYDLQAARDAGIASIGFTSGGWTADELSDAIAVYAGPQALADVLAG